MFYSLIKHYRLHIWAVQDECSDQMDDDTYITY